MKEYDRIIIGGGLYGLYAAYKSAIKGLNVLLLEKECDIFQKASYINQARIHNGLHYPRSIETAMQCASTYERFVREHFECINDKYSAIYAIAQSESKVEVPLFVDLMRNLEICYEEIPVRKYFNSMVIQSAYITKECTFDYNALKHHYLSLIQRYSSNVDIRYCYTVSAIKYLSDRYIINDEYCTISLFNTSYASVNQIANLLVSDFIDIKYELCEVVLCKIVDEFKNIGITVMDGNFFSIMPFGMTSFHSLTTVQHTPHETSQSLLPIFKCMSRQTKCSQQQLWNCQVCEYKPISHFCYMNNLAHCFLNPNISLEYKQSLYAIKPILRTAELDDARPTVIKSYANYPNFYSILSGKISTLYELDRII